MHESVLDRTINQYYYLLTAYWIHKVNANIGTIELNGNDHNPNK